MTTMLSDCLLALDFSVESRLEAVLVDSPGRPLERSAYPVSGPEEYAGALSLAVRGLTAPPTAVCVSLPLQGPEDHPVARELIASALPDSWPVWVCDTDEAVLAGSLRGTPGVVLEGISAPVLLARDRGGRSLRRAHSEGGPDWLLASAAQLGTRIPRVRALLGDPPRLSGFLDLAGFPGPEPECLALLKRSARIYSDLARSLIPRLAWSGPVPVALRGPLFNQDFLELLRREVGGHLPMVRWRTPELPPVAGCLLLLLGALTEHGRRHPEASGPPPGVHFVDGDAWRGLARLRRPLDGWTD